ncbi:Light-sensor Protein kinase, partial [Rhizophlyctis rosea]
LRILQVSENSKTIIGVSPSSLLRLKSFLELLDEEQEDIFWDHIEHLQPDDVPMEAGPDVFTLRLRNDLGDGIYSPPKSTEDIARDVVTSHAGGSFPGRGRHPTRTNSNRSSEEEEEEEQYDDEDEDDDESRVAYFCAVHRYIKNPDVIVVELEFVEDTMFPLMTRQEDDNLKEFLEAGNMDVSDEALYAASTESKHAILGISEPGSTADSGELFTIMEQVNAQLAACIELRHLADVIVGLVHEITGYHRVILYQYDEDFNGCAIAEYVETKYGSHLYRGLHFPHTDIPPQARQLYKTNKIRLLYDRDLPTARMVSYKAVGGKPLDMSFAYLRALSPIHRNYLANMKVRATMSISITSNDELWGLICCHGYTAMRNPLPLRKACRYIGEAVAQHIERVVYEERLRMRKVVTGHGEGEIGGESVLGGGGLGLGSGPEGYVLARAEEVVAMFRADIGFITINGETQIIHSTTGDPPSEELKSEALELSVYLHTHVQPKRVIYTHRLSHDYPKFTGRRQVAGFLVLPLADDGSSFLVFLRREQLHRVQWAGNPYTTKVTSLPTSNSGITTKLPTPPSEPADTTTIAPVQYTTMHQDFTTALAPRQSFHRWTETVHDQCQAWTDDELETAHVLQMMYWKFIDVSRRGGDGLGGVGVGRFKRLLLSNATHEIRTPMNHLINCIEMALERTLDNDTRAVIVQSHETTKSLLGMINDLLDVTKELETPAVETMNPM